VLVSAAHYFPEQARVIMRQMTVESKTEENGRSCGNAMSTAPYLATITARTLIVHGDRDPLYPVSIAVEMYSSIPRSYLWIVPNGGHGPVFGDRSNQFRETAVAFLRNDGHSAQAKAGLKKAENRSLTVAVRKRLPSRDRKRAVAGRAMMNSIYESRQNPRTRRA